MPNAVDAGLHDGTAVEVAVPVTCNPDAPPPSNSPPDACGLRIEPLPPAQQARIGLGTAAWVTYGSPFKPGPNEDAVASISLPANRGLLLVADGLGGHRGGRRASQLICSSLKKACRQLATPSKPLMISGVIPIPTSDQGRNELRSAVLGEIERANQRLLRSRAGSATTLAVVEINGNRARTYHIGDSEILIVSQRGRIKFASVSHSPIGYALEAGMMTEEQALFHPDRHLVSNVIGSEHMSVELGPWISLSPRDTVLIASDGLFDNLLQYEIIELIRKGKLATGVSELAAVARDRMLHPDNEFPSKPDDLTILAYRAE